MAEPRGPLLSPGFWLHHAALTWRAKLDDGLRELGLTHTQFNLLASANHLQRTQGPPTQQQVAELSGADRMMTSKVAATLEERGLLLRQPHESDSRAKRLEVTPQGSALVLRAVKVAAAVDSECFGDGPGREHLRDQLQQIAGLR